jgi:hypothetical protein
VVAGETDQNSYPSFGTIFEIPFPEDGVLERNVRPFCNFSNLWL